MKESNLPSAISKKDYELVFLTPLLMHGADPKNKAEFRIASMKGLLRYWWRALETDSDISRLLSKEETLFGGTNDKKRKSPISIKIINVEEEKSRFNALPHKISKFKVPGIQGKASIRLQTMKKLESTKSYYENLFEGMLHLTGMGQRARRGFGSCQLKMHNWENVNDFTKSLKKNLDTILVEDHFVFTGSSSVLVERKLERIPAHPVLGKIYIGKGEPEAGKVTSKIGEASHLGNPHGTLGSVKKGRFASPLWCTVRKIGGLYYPIISEMYTNKKKTNAYEKDLSVFLREVGVHLG